MKVQVGERIIFTGFGEDSSWRCECIVTNVSDPEIVTDPSHWTFTGKTDSGKPVGGYFDQIIEIVSRIDCIRA